MARRAPDPARQQAAPLRTHAGARPTEQPLLLETVRLRRVGAGGAGRRARRRGGRRGGSRSGGRGTSLE
eukprot:scaffold91784_cov30-Phaeocystis_antarctica.AAC.1